MTRERLVAFDANGEVHSAYQGTATSVSFPRSLLNLEGATVTHGHPKGMEEFGGTFSFADVNNTLNSKWAEHRATASGQGEMNYIMRRTAGAKPEKLRDRINKDYPRLTKKIDETYDKAYSKAKKDGKSRKEAMHLARQRAVGVLNAYYKKTMPKYGFEYITRKKDYKYGR